MATDIIHIADANTDIFPIKLYDAADGSSTFLGDLLPFLLGTITGSIPPEGEKTLELTRSEYTIEINRPEYTLTLDT